MADPRVDKYVAWESAPQPVGITTLTKHLEAVPWISAGVLRRALPRGVVAQRRLLPRLHPVRPDVAGGLVRGPEDVAAPTSWKP